MQHIVQGLYSVDSQNVDGKPVPRGVCFSAIQANTKSHLLQERASAGAEHIPFRPIPFLLFCPPLQPYHHSGYNFSWKSLFARVCVGLPPPWFTSVRAFGSNGTHFSDEYDTIELRVSNQSFWHKMRMHFCQVRIYKQTQINVDGMLPKKSLGMLTVICSSIMHSLCNETNWIFSHALENSCVCIHVLRLFDSH